jgi:hypothetical protein
MLTKEQLLSKGLSPDAADEILAAVGEQKDENSLTALRKALEPKDKEAGKLFKAEGEEEDDEEDDEEEEKKFMKKKKMKKSDDNDVDDDLKKAIDSIDSNADGAIVEMADLSPILEAIVDSNVSMKKAIDVLFEKVEKISKQNEKSFEILHKAASVTAETADSIGGFLGTPQGRKGAVVGDPAKSQSGAVLDPKAVYSALAKAMQAGDSVAGTILEVFESSGKNVRALNPQRQAYVAELLKKEVK